MGSGTTAEACVNTNREWIGSEIDKECSQMTIDRINSLDNRYFTNRN